MRCCARCKYTKELADAKAENMLCVSDVAAGRCRLHIASPSVMREATTASGVDNAALRLADTAERDGFTPGREADHYAKTTGRNSEVY